MVLAITGMHRSGTSLTASWMDRCALPLSDGSVYGASEGNPRGHFEDRDFVRLHNQSILRVAPGSHGWKYTGRSRLSFDQAETDRASELIRIRNGKFADWGWKDPRTTLFLDEYKKLIPDLKVLFTWRDCRSVAASLVRRSEKMNTPLLKVNAYQSVALWKRYNSLVYEYRLKYPDDTVLFELGSLINNNARAADLIRQRFGLQFDYVSMNDLFDQSIMGRSKHNRLVNIYARLLSTGRLEKQLSAVSDLG